MRRTLVVAALGLLLGSSVVVLVLVDRLVGWLADPQFVPLAGVPRSDAVLVRPEFRVRARTNAEGFRGPPLPGAKPPGVFRIVALGDSFTWGFGVREWQAYPARLAHRLTALLGGPPRVEVVNLGLPGTGPLDYLYHLERSGLSLAPDLVLVGLFANDVNDVYQLRRFGARSPLWALNEARAGRRPWWKRSADAALPNLYLVGARAVARLRPAVREARADAGTPGPGPMPEPTAVLAALGRRYGARAAILARYRALAPDDRRAVDGLVRGEPLGADVRPAVLLAALMDPDAEVDSLLLRSPGRREAWAETADVLARLVQEAQRHGARTVLAVLPASEQVSRARWEYLRGVGYRMDPAMLSEAPLVEHVRAVAAHEGAGFVDLVRPFRTHRHAGLYFEQDEHWNARGQAFASARLAAALVPFVQGDR